MINYINLTTSNTDTQYPSSYITATEDFLTNRKNDTFVMFSNSPNGIYLGNSQDIYQQVNIDKAKEYDCSLSRRDTGGGAIFSSAGTINISLVCDSSSELLNNFQQLICDFLVSLNIPAQISNNDILINNKKVCGLASAYEQQRVLLHGVILFNENLSIMDEVLISNQEKLKSKGFSAISDYVINVKPFVDMSFKDFLALLIAFITNNDFTTYTLTEEDHKSIYISWNHKYGNDNWIYNNIPSKDYNNSVMYEGRTVETHFNLDNNFIKDIIFTGDFFGNQSVKEFEALLNNTNINDLDDNIPQDISKYFGIVPREVIINLILESIK